MALLQGRSSISLANVMNVVSDYLWRKGEPPVCLSWLCRVGIRLFGHTRYSSFALGCAPRFLLVLLGGWWHPQGTMIVYWNLTYDVPFLIFALRGGGPASTGFVAGPRGDSSIGK